MPLVTKGNHPFNCGATDLYIGCDLFEILPYLVQSPKEISLVSTTICIRLDKRVRKNLEKLYGNFVAGFEKNGRGRYEK